MQREDKEWLFLLTSRYHVAVLAYDPASEDVLTKAYGDVKVCDSSDMSGSGMVTHQGVTYVRMSDSGV